MTFCSNMLSHISQLLDQVKSLFVCLVHTSLMPRPSPTLATMALLLVLTLCLWFVIANLFSFLAWKKAINDCENLKKSQGIGTRPWMRLVFALDVRWPTTWYTNVQIFPTKKKATRISTILRSCVMWCKSACHRYMWPHSCALANESPGGGKHFFSHPPYSSVVLHLLPMLGCDNRKLSKIVWFTHCLAQFHVPMQFAHFARTWNENFGASTNGKIHPKIPPNYLFAKQIATTLAKCTFWFNVEPKHQIYAKYMGK